MSVALPARARDHALPLRPAYVRDLCFATREQENRSLAPGIFAPPQHCLPRPRSVSFPPDADRV
jgi:hypothetical protein